VTPAERRTRQLAAIFQQGWDDGANDPPLTERQIERLAFLIAPSIPAATARADAPMQRLPVAA
jgi:hypothetical protein